MRNILFIIVILSFCGCAKDKSTPVAPPNFKTKIYGYSTVWFCIGKTLEVSNESFVVTLLRKDKSEAEYILDVSRKYLNSNKNSYSIATKLVGLFNSTVEIKNDVWQIQNADITLNDKHPTIAIYNEAQLMLTVSHDGDLDHAVTIDCHSQKIVSD